VAQTPPLRQRRQLGRVRRDRLPVLRLPVPWRLPTLGSKRSELLLLPPFAALAQDAPEKLLARFVRRIATAPLLRQSALHRGLEDGCPIAFQVGLGALEFGDSVVELGKESFDSGDDSVLLGRRREAQPELTELLAGNTRQIHTRRRGIRMGDDIARRQQVEQKLVRKCLTLVEHQELRRGHPVERGLDHLVQLGAQPSVENIP